VEFIPLITSDHDIHQIHLFILDIEIQRSHIRGNGNADIIGHYPRPGIALYGVLRQRSTTAKGKTCESEEK
jgi:hypothetical protein